MYKIAHIAICDLCRMAFDSQDENYEHRKKTHERWHTNCRKEKRNTTEGRVNWIIE